MDLTIFKAPYSLTSKSKLKKTEESNARKKNSNNEYELSPNTMEIIMEDVLALLNIDVSYNERVSQIDNIMNKNGNSYKELILTVVSTTLNYEQNTYIITPLGLKNSKRLAKDGIVLFGYEKKDNFKRGNDLDNENNIYIIFII